jgi:hypothetical protein
MPAIQIDTDDAVFAFAYDDLAEIAINRICPDDDRKVINEIKRRSESGSKDVVITGNEGGYYFRRVVYVVAELLISGKGTVYCKQCGHTYQASQLKITNNSPVSFIHTSIATVKQLQKELGMKRPVRVPGTGWTVITCAKGHELLRVLDWIS